MVDDSAPQDGDRIRVAAAGDVHASEGARERLVRVFDEIAPQVDLILLAGDLTTHGEPDQALVLADACRLLDVPIFAVLGNHDHHAGRADEVNAVLSEAGVTVLERDWRIHEVDGHEIGIVGTKGFIGGFPGYPLPDFGEPLLRRVYAETGEEVAALEHGLQSVAHCPVRIVLLHYAPIEDTLEGEPIGIRTFLGSDRLARPIAEYPPDIVLHGHAHAGTFAGLLGDIPVYNVAIHVTRRDFWIFEVDPARARHADSVRVESS